jgi:DNA-binding beta-propeller fold protein YncE
MAYRWRTWPVGAVTGALVLAAGLGLGFAPGPASALSATSGAASISLPNFVPQGVAVDSDTDTAYVGGSWSTVQKTYGLQVIDLATDTVTATIPDVGAEGSIAVDQATDMVYADGPGYNMSVINGATNTVTTIPLNSLDAVGGRNQIAVDAATDIVYIGVEQAPVNGDRFAVAGIDGRTNAVVTTATIPGDGDPTSIAVNPATNTVYATDDVSGGGGHHIEVISGASGTVTDTISPRFGAPDVIAVNPSNNVFDVANALEGDSVSAYSGATDAVLGTTTFTEEDPLSIAVNTATDAEYVVLPDAVNGSRIAQINGAGTAVTGMIPVADWGWVAIDSATDTLVLAEANSTVGVIPLKAPAIGGRDSATFTVGRGGSVGLAATGTPAPRVTEQGKLPAGVSLSVGGTLSGTPKAGAGGVYPITITAANGVASAATKRFTVTVDQAPAIISVNHATFTVGRPGLLTVRTTAFPTATASEQGALPAGFRFTAERNGRATIAGIPAKSARGKTYVIHFTARNGVGGGVVQRFTLRVG